MWVICPGATFMTSPAIPTFLSCKTGNVWWQYSGKRVNKTFVRWLYFVLTHKWERLSPHTIERVVFLLQKKAMTYSVALGLMHLSLSSVNNAFLCKVLILLQWFVASSWSWLCKSYLLMQEFAVKVLFIFYLSNKNGSLGAVLQRNNGG